MIFGQLHCFLFNSNTTAQNGEVEEQLLGGFKDCAGRKAECEVELGVRISETASLPRNLAAHLEEDDIAEVQYIIRAC